MGGVLAFITFQIIAHAYVTTINGWTTMFGCGEPGNGILLRAACAKEFPGPINVPQEAMYWTTKSDAARQKLSGEHAYILHFPPGGLPPNDAFWSLTMADAHQRFVPNPINRYSVSDRSDLVQNADASVDIHIQNTAPAGHDSNWLPAPPGNFILWLRVYLPGKANWPRAGSTRCQQSSKRNDIGHVAQASRYVRVGHGCGMDGRHVALYLLLAARRD